MQSKTILTIVILTSHIIKCIAEFSSEVVWNNVYSLTNGIPSIYQNLASHDIQSSITAWTMNSENGQYHYYSLSTSNSSHLFGSNNYGLSFIRMNELSFNLIYLTTSANGQYVLGNGDMTSLSLYTSNDNGITMNLIAFASGETYFHSHKTNIICAMSSSGKFQAAVGVFLNYQPSIFISSDFGSSWDRMSQLNNDQSLPSEISISGNGKLHVYTSRSRLYISSNYGKTYNSLFQYPGYDKYDTDQGYLSTIVSENGKYQSVAYYFDGITTVFTSNGYGIDGSWSIATGYNKNTRPESSTISSTGQYQCFQLSSSIYCSSDWGVTYSKANIDSSSIITNVKMTSDASIVGYCFHNWNSANNWFDSKIFMGTRSKSSNEKSKAISFSSKSVISTNPSKQSMTDLCLSYCMKEPYCFYPTEFPTTNPTINPTIKPSSDATDSPTLE